MRDGSWAGRLCAVSISLTVLGVGCANGRDPGPDVSGVATGQERATGGLLALYEFSEGQGNVVGGIGPTLIIADPARVRWESGALFIEQSTVLRSATPPAALTNAIAQSGEFTVEAWITPANVTQDGPARIVNLSGSSRERNFTLGAGLWGNRPSDVLDVRLRTSSTDRNGRPSLSTQAGSLAVGLNHVVFTRSTTGLSRIYVDGVVRAEESRAGNLGDWDSSFPLLLANEADGRRPWLGGYHLVAIYDHALTAPEVAQNFAAGPGDGGEPPPPPPPPNEPPVASASADPTSGTAPLPVEFDGSGSIDPDGSIASWDWTFGDGATGTGESVSHVFSAPGSYPVELTVTDDQQASATTSVLVTVSAPENQLPVAGISVEPATGTWPLSVTLDGGTSNDPDGTIVSWDWDFGDGETDAGATVTHVFQTAGSFTVTLIVTDDAGATATASADVTVTEPPTPGARVGGALVLYEFEAGGGSVVSDTSGVEPRLDLFIENPAAVSWSGGGLSIDSATRAISATSADKVNDVIRTSNELTMEAWVTPQTVSQSGPARIVSISAGADLRNLTLGHGLWGTQPQDLFDVRLRTTDTSVSGTPSLSSPSGSLAARLTHVVYTRDTSGLATIYVDGSAVVSRIVGGDTGNWADYVLVLGNEVGADRPWLGRYELVALYGRALTPAEIGQNYLAGPDGDGGDVPDAPPVASFVAAPPAGLAPLTVIFDAAGSSDVGGQIVAWDWDFGDGGSGSGVTASHLFQDPGTYDVTLTVTDDSGQTDAITSPVVVSVPCGQGAPAEPVGTPLWSPSPLMPKQRLHRLAEPGLYAYSPHRDFGCEYRGSGHTHASPDHSGIDAAVQEARLRDLSPEVAQQFTWLTVHSLVGPDPGVDNFQHLFGIEVYASVGENGVAPHVLGYFKDGALVGTNPFGAYTSSFAEVVEAVHEEGGLASLAHPSRYPTTDGELLAVGNLWGIEVVSGDSDPEVNAAAWDRRLGSGRFTCANAGGDIHAEDYRFTRGVQVVSSPEAVPTQAGLHEQVAACNFFACRSWNDDYPLLKKPRLTVEDGAIVFTSDDVVDTIRFVGRGGATLATASSTMAASYVPDGSEGYVRVEAHQSTGAIECYSQPVWLMHQDDPEIDAPTDPDAGIDRGDFTVAATATSETVDLSWALIPDATRIRVYLGPEPALVQGEALPLEVEVADLGGAATGVSINELAARTQLFFRVVAETLVGQKWGNAQVQTIGGPRATLDTPLRSVHLVAPDVVALVLSTPGTVSGAGRKGEAFQGGSWSVSRASGASIDVSAVHRRSIPVGQPDYPVGFGQFGNDGVVDVDDWIFLKLAESVGSPEILRVTHAGGGAETDLSVSFAFSDWYAVSLAIQVNQVGYNPRATRRYAYLGAHLGDGGAADLSGVGGSADVFAEPRNLLRAPRLVLEGVPIALRSSADEEAGGPVREIDLAFLPPAEGVRYRVRVPGLGVSPPTSVSEEAAMRVFYTVARGLFLNRWCGDLASSYSDWNRAPDHCSAYFVTGTSHLDQFFASDTPQSDERLVVGGHHDAGDFDIRPYHVLVSQFLMRAFELDPEKYADGQLDIPESGNGIPDLLDEALWSLAAWEALQNSDGSVRAGVESYRHPLGIYFASDDQLPYWTFDAAPWHTAYVAALFAQAAYLLEPYDASHSSDLLGRAELAYAWAVAQAAPEEYLLYAAGELARTTGGSQYRSDYETLWNAMGPDGPLQNFRISKEVSAPSFVDNTPAMPDHLLAYLALPDAQSPIVDRMVAKLSSVSDAVRGSFLSSPHAYRNGRATFTRPDWGQSVGTGRQVDSVYQVLQAFDLSSELERDSVDVLSLAADYALGANPRGQVYITGLGTNSPREPLHNDSLAFVKAQGRAPVPGLPVYGPIQFAPGAGYFTPVAAAFYPPFDQQPLGMRYADTRTAVNTTEFSVWEMQAPMAELFAVLAPARLRPDSWRPGGSEHASALPGHRAD